VGDLKGQAQDRGGMALSPKFRNDDVADMPAYAQEKVVQRVPYRHPSDDPPAREGKEKRRWNVLRREIHASFLLSEHLEVATEGHPFLVVVEEVRNFWGGRAVRAHELVLFVLSRPSNHQGLRHDWLTG
jgi:hypothetical protein